MGVFSGHRIERGERQHNPVAAYLEGKSWIRVESNEVAILTPLSSKPVNIMLWKWNTTEGEIPEQREIKNAVSSYLVLPEVGFRVLPQGVPFHLAVVPIKKMEK